MTGRVRHALASMAIVNLLAQASAVVYAQPDGAREYQVKGAFVYGLLKFVDWPASAQPSADGPLTVGVVGTPPDEFASALAGKVVRGHKVAVHAYARAEDVKRCQVLFVVADADPAQRAIAAEVGSSPVLTVVEDARVPASAAVITLEVVNAKLAFHVNLDVAEARGLQVSSNLLGLAKTVKSSRLNRAEGGRRSGS